MIKYGSYLEVLFEVYFEELELEAIIYHGHLPGPLAPNHAKSLMLTHGATICHSHK